MPLPLILAALLGEGAAAAAAGAGAAAAEGAAAATAAGAASAAGAGAAGAAGGAAGAGAAGAGAAGAAGASTAAAGAAPAAATPSTFSRAAQFATQMAKSQGGGGKYERTDIKRKPYVWQGERREALGGFDYGYDWRKLGPVQLHDAVPWGRMEAPGATEDIGSRGAFAGPMSRNESFTNGTAVATQDRMHFLTNVGQKVGPDDWGDLAVGSGVRGQVGFGSQTGRLNYPSAIEATSNEVGYGNQVGAGPSMLALGRGQSFNEGAGITPKGVHRARQNIADWGGSANIGGLSG